MSVGARCLGTPTGRPSPTASVPGARRPSGPLGRTPSSRLSHQTGWCSRLSFLSSFATHLPACGLERSFHSPVTG